MQKTKKKSFDWYGMRQHFSIRKYHFGAASVLLGMSLALGAGAQVAQAEATVASSEATTATIASSTDSSASSEAVVTEATVASTTETAVSAAETATSTSTETVASTTETVVSTERTATINYIVQYVLEDGTLVKADVKTTSVTTTEATATSTVEVTTELPLGYELATGQAATVSQEVTENGENIVTVKVVKKAEEKAATTTSTETAKSSEAAASTTSTETAKSSEAATTTATVAETVKTPATVEEAKVVLEQVTSEAEVLANEAERLVAASDSDNTALKAAAAATKLTATEATVVLNDSAATLEAVNAQIDAVRTNVEALALELRKFLGTDAIEIALNTSVSNLNVTEGEGILVGTTSTATPTMDDPHGASVGRHSLPTGVATTEDGWFTFAVYDLRSYNTNQAGSVVGGSAVPAYIRYSLDKDPTTATVLAELVSTTDGRVLEKVTIEPGAEVALSYPTTVDAKNEPVKLVYDTSEAVEGGVSGTIQFSAQDKDSGNYGSYSTTYVPPYVVNTTRYVTENGDLIATYNVQTISGQPVTSSGQREFTGVEYVSQSIEVADSIYPKGSKSVATTYDIGTAKVKVIREVVDHGKMTLTFYVTDPSYTKPYDLVTTDTTGFLPVFQTSELTHRVGDKYVYNHNQNFIGNYLTDPNDPTGSRKIYAVSAPNDKGSMYRIVANFSGDNSTDGVTGRLYLTTEVWTTKTNGENDKDFAWHTGLGGDKFHNKGFAPGGRQNILRVGTLASANQITYVYRALEQEAIIRYQVEGATDYLEESAIQTGGSGSDINYSTEDTINKYKKLGYTLVSDNFTTDAGQDYDYDTKVRQEFLVVIKPRIEEVPNTAVPGQPVDPTDPNSPVWPDSINNLETTQEVTRTTEYKYEDGTPVRVDASGNILPKGSEGTPLVKTETVTFTRPAQVNLVTGEVTYGEWAADSTDVLNGNLIPEITDYTATRTTLEGADAPMTESVTDKTVVATDADINEVVYYKPNPKYGDVVVNYVNTDGKVIATPVVDTNDALVDTDYSTADQVPAKIVEDATGDVYYYKEIKAEDATKETGKVVEGTTEVTYVYEKAGDVVIKYVDVNGLELQAPVADTTDGKPGSDYNTAEGTEKPATITTADGKVYALVPAGDYPVGTVAADSNLASGATPTGTVEAGVTKEVTYVYQEVKSDVVVEYYDTEGNPISGTETGNATSVVDTEDASVGTDYNTDDKKPAKITAADGTVYYYKEVKDTSKPTTGKVAETTTTVQYVYEKAGDVIVHYITTDGTPISGVTNTGSVTASTVDDTVNGKPGSTYDTSDLRPTTITTDEGKTYELVPTATIGNETGDVEAGKTTEVTYVYKEVKGSVVVNYISTTGEELQAQVVDTPESSTGTGYDTTDVKPETITTKDGRTFKLVPKMTQGSETGDVVPGVTEVTYVYEEVKGDVVVNYVNTDGKVIATPVVDTKTTSTGTAYDTTDNKPEKIVEDATGDVYYILPTDEVKAGDKETGKVVEGTTEVTYIYQKAGNVVVNYTLADGTVIKDPVNDETNQEPGYDYNTKDNKPETITTTDGKVYKLVPAATIGNETGDVEAGKTIEVTYIYEEVKSDVVVEYYNTAGDVIAKTVVDEDDKSVGTVYNTDEDNKPEKITTEDGTVYYYKEVKDSSAPTTGKVAETTTTVQYVYEQAGNVVVNYITEDGTVIKDPVKDEENAEPGKTYSTEDNKPTSITTKDGKTYELIPTATIGTEEGTVEAGKTTEVTYVYKEVKGSVVVNYVTTDGTVIKDPVTDTPETSTGTSYDTTDNKPETITKDGKTYKLVPKLTQGSETGDVVPGVTQVTYVYEEVKGDVVVNYVNTAGEVIAPQVVDTKTTSTGTDYDTTDNKPAKITATDGTVYYYKEVKAGDNETGKVVEGTTEVTYIYEKAGSVTVNYVTTDGKVIKTPVKDEENAEPGKTYSTEDNKPTTITTEDGKTYRLVPNKTTGEENGTVTSGEDKQITYVYEEVKGNVVVEYYNTAGEKIATDVEDTPASSTGTAYTTLDNKPETITATDGTVYYYKEVKSDSAAETGDVVEGTTTVKYVYEQAGNVVVNYITEDGTVIKTPVNDETNAAPGSEYNTTDNKPTTITTEDGKTYELIPTATIGTEEGTVEAGKTTEVTYVYRKVETPAAKTGNVVVEYYNTAGEKIASDVVDTPETTTGTVYETFDFKPATITKDGVTYFYKEVKDTSAAEKGTVVEGTTTVQYVYEPAGSVTVNYVTTDGTVIKSPVKDEENAESGKTYSTEDNKPTTITTEDGKTYKLVPNATTGEENGSVTSGEDKQVTYVYEEVKGDVVVNYIDTEGNVIKAPVTDTPSTSTGTSYDTTDNKPTTITTEDGTEYKLVPVLTKGEENGSVVEGTTQVTYVYQKVTTPAPNPNGSVVVNYVNTNGETIATSVNDTTDAALDTTYDTTDFKPAVIKHNGVTYFYKEVKAGDNESGKVVEGTTEVTYVYEPAGSVTVNYVTTNGTVIKSPVKDEENAEPGKTYTTEDNKPTTITTEDGKTYKLVPSLTTGEENGSVTSGEDKQVTYVYEEVKGDVVVNYIDTEGNVIKASVTDTPSTSTGTSYNTTDNKPTTITIADGSVYELVPVLTQGNENGSVVEGTTQVTYVYRKVSSAVKSPVTNHVDENGKSISPQEDGTKPNTSIPGYEFTGKTTIDKDGNVTHVYRKVSPKGTVVVNYVTEDGTVISKPVTDTPSSDVDTPYDTTDNKPGTITFNGEEYELVRVEGTENGTVVEGETVVTYVYRKVMPATKVVTNHVDEEGNVISPQEDGTTPDKSIPGYEFTGKTTTDENGNTTHVYRKKINVVITYVDTNGVELKSSVVDTEGAAIGTSYDTKQDDNEYPLYIVKGESVYKRVLAGDFTIGQTTEDGHLVSSDSAEGAVAAGTKVVTYVYELVTPAKSVVTNHVDEEGNVISPKEDGTKPNTSIPGYEFTGKTTVDEDGNVTHVYRKVKAVVTNHVDEDGNIINPQEDGTTPDKSIPGYEFTGKTITDENGNTTHIYRKIPANPTTPVTPEPGRPGTPVPSAPAKPGQPATPKAGKAQLPNTGETSSATGVLGVAMLVATLAIAGKRRRNED